MEMSEIMGNQKEKKIGEWIAAAIGIVIISFMAFISFHEYESRKLYCGTVNQLYIVPAGYKAAGKHRIVFYCQKTGRKINIECTENTWSNAKIGSHICFELVPSQAE